MIYKSSIFLKQNIPKNVIFFDFIVGKIQRIDIFY